MGRVWRHLPLITSHSPREPNDRPPPSSFPRKREPRDGPGRGATSPSSPRIAPTNPTMRLLPPRHSRESGNPGTGRGAGPPPLITSHSPANPTMRLLPPRHSRESGNPGMGRAVGKPSPSSPPRPPANPTMGLLPLVIPAKAGTQGWAGARGISLPNCAPAYKAESPTYPPAALRYQSRKSFNPVNPDSDNKRTGRFCNLPHPLVIPAKARTQGWARRWANPPARPPSPRP